MKAASARLLRMLTLLQVRPFWSGQDLADRLEVSTRTVRRDVDMLRGLGYPVKAVKGITGGYRLAAGAQLPPLLLDDEEAVAIAIALRTATSSNVTGIGESALRALIKLEQLLPSRLRHRIDALQISTVRTPGGGASVDAEVLSAIGTACRDHHRLRFDFRGLAGATSLRVTEPYELVNWGQRWYLVAWDLERDDWGTFPVDRMQLGASSGPRFTPRDLPRGDGAAHVARSVAQMWPDQATIRLHTSQTTDAGPGAS
jgi:predicted DNA-binding transcriptional regulator YafY